MRRASRCSTARLDLSIYRYSTSCYYEDVYIQGGNFLDDIRKSMGSTTFFRAIRDYVAANRYKLAATRDAARHARQPHVAEPRPELPRRASRGSTSAASGRSRRGRPSGRPSAVRPLVFDQDGRGPIWF